MYISAVSLSSNYDFSDKHPARIVHMAPKEVMMTCAIMIMVKAHLYLWIFDLVHGDYPVDKFNKEGNLGPKSLNPRSESEWTIFQRNRKNAIICEVLKILYF